MSTEAENPVAAVAAAVAAELRLLDPEVRASPELVLELLDPDFVEFGASGRRWDRATVMAAVAPDGAGTGAPVTAHRMAGTLLAPGLVHLTYVSGNGTRRARRSSLWRHTADGWRLYFHQGTPVREA